MPAVRMIAGSAISAVLALVVFKIIPYTPDLSDWGGRTFPRTYIEPLVMVFVVSYLAGYTAARFSPSTGRLSGMVTSLVVAIVLIGFDFSSGILNPLFHHPAYPVFSDHALLALAALLTGGHLGGLRVERSVLKEQTKPGSTRF